MNWWPWKEWKLIAWWRTSTGNLALEFEGRGVFVNCGNVIYNCWVSHPGGVRQCESRFNNFRRLIDSGAFDELKREDIAAGGGGGDA